ncbi:hypothetical protein X747_12660 [Mesorhizobium sp. LNJC384A00]|uniref:hypothetical protein n=1 Tax=Mesorhizobium sp. LNJC384A00 TaxID=1287268 RepID=UPI0003CE1133|nr:hypothetical protein [Mesorhizobium sp. LNJC384A00]ESY42571.1 hypothetical protein X747_12660 [Mesorhizobium sp. LNJC384A00]
MVSHSRPKVTAIPRKQRPKVIKTQSGLFDWLAEEVKNSKPQVMIAKGWVDQFDEIVMAVGQTGWWHFDGSKDDFLEALTDRVNQSESLVCCSKNTQKLIGDMAACPVDVRRKSELRIHCLFALIYLLGHRGDDKVEYWQDKTGLHAKSRKKFERYGGVKIDVSLKPKRVIPR